MKQILHAYYEDNARKLRRTVDRLLLKFGGLSDSDRDDFYSLANEVFVDAMKRYDESLPFESFLYSCLSNRIKTEMTGRNCQKRRADRLALSLDMPAGEEDATIGDMIAGSCSIEQEVLEAGEEGYSRRMTAYLSRLSSLQRKVLGLRCAGYQPNEIRETLHITKRQYADCYAAIHSYQNVSLLYSCEQ